MSTNPVNDAWGKLRPTGWSAAWLRLIHRLPPGRRWRRIALWLRKPLKHALAEWVDVEIWGLKLRLRSRGNLSEQRLLLMPQYLDAQERRSLAETLKDGGVFLDIGANAGVYALWVAARCGQRVRVEAFEPDAELCARLSFNLATNGIRSVTVNQIALGDREGGARFLAGAGNQGENRVETSGSAGTAVPMTTLPAFLTRAGITRIDALKIDVEGQELSVLKPLFADTPRAVWPRWIICEVVLDERRELAGLLAAHGYVLVASGRLNGIYRLESQV